MLFGAATHDIGKTAHIAELSGPGSAHEQAGRQLLLNHGISPELARFAATHAPWTGDGQTWRVLRVTYPAGWIATHNLTELYYFDYNFMQRRMDYQPEVNGFAPTAHYQAAEKTFDGIVVPTQRRVLTRNDDRTPDRSGTPITLDVSHVKLARQPVNGEPGAQQIQSRKVSFLDDPNEHQPGSQDIPGV